MTTYYVVRRAETFTDIFKDFTALMIINEFDDILGSALLGHFKLYPNMCQFKNLEDGGHYEMEQAIL